MPFSLSPNEINTIAAEIFNSLLPRLNAMVQQASKVAHVSLVQLTVKDVAKQLQLSEKTIQKYIGEGRLRASNLGTHEKPMWRISQQAVQDLSKH